MPGSCIEFGMQVAKQTECVFYDISTAAGGRALQEGYQDLGWGGWQVAGMAFNNNINVCFGY